MVEAVEAVSAHEDKAHHHPHVGKVDGRWFVTCDCSSGHITPNYWPAYLGRHPGYPNWRAALVNALFHSTQIT